MFFFPFRLIKKSKFLQNEFKNTTLSYKRLGNFIINDVVLVYSKNNNNDKKYVLKKYNSFFSLVKWTLIKTISFYCINYTISGSQRLNNEIKGLQWSKNIGSNFGMHAPFYYDKINTAVVIDFVDGIPIDKYTEFSNKKFFSHYKNIGTIIANLHLHNFYLGDCKAENIFYSKDGKYQFLDFEQFNASSNNEVIKRVWDVTELFYYLGHYFPFRKRFEFLKKLIWVFLTNYYQTIFSSNAIDNQTKQRLFDELGKIRYIILYVTFMSPFTFFFILKTIKEWKIHFKSKMSNK